MSSDILRFPKDDFVEETKTIKTPAGEKTVVCRVYKHLQYVEKPVDAGFQSLNVTVPVSIEGKLVDPTNAPILFVIGVGGYMSCRNKGESAMTSMPSMPAMPGGMGPGGPGMPPPGGPGGPMPGAPGVDVADLCLLKGYVVVEPGCRGRDNQFPDGRYYGKAPAAIVDLKAAVRYIRHNNGFLPGNSEWIFSTGGSAGGALSTLLGASGNSPLYDPYLKAIGAADQRDDIFGTCSLSAITNLENADGAYEWEYGALSLDKPFDGPTGIDTAVRGQPVDQSLSAQLKEIFINYQDSLALDGKGGYGKVSGANMADYLLKAYLEPSCERFLAEKTEAEKAEYLGKNPWITYDGKKASFTFADFAAHCGRMKGLPAFDDFEKAMAEPVEFGSETEDSRHFTEYSLRHATGDQNAKPDDEVIMLRNLMNPMYFVHNPGCAPHWWVRHGACDNHTSIPVITDLADSMAMAGKDVNARLVWDGGHCANDDPEAFVEWMASTTGYNK